MRIGFRSGTGSTGWARYAAMVVLAALANGQTWDVTPLFGRRWGGSIKLHQEGLPHNSVLLEDTNTFGVAAGYRIPGDDCDRCALIEFRWMTQTANLAVAWSSAKPSIRLDHFLGDFTREFPLSEDRDIVRPYIGASLGAATLSTPVESRTRFVFGFSGGVKVFPKPRWGLRVHAEYLPMVMHAEMQRVICAGGCIVTVNGGVMNQFSVSIGPVFRF